MNHVFSAAYGNRHHCQTCGEHRAEHPPRHELHERQIEDHGEFGVYWYRRPTGHSKSAPRLRGDTPWITEWAYVLKAPYDVLAWRVGSSVPGFASRATAIHAAIGVSDGQGISS